MTYLKCTQFERSKSEVPTLFMTIYKINNIQNEIVFQYFCDIMPCLISVDIYDLKSSLRNIRIVPCTTNLRKQLFLFPNP